MKIIKNLTLLLVVTLALVGLVGCNRKDNSNVVGATFRGTYEGEKDWRVNPQSMKLVFEKDGYFTYYWKENLLANGDWQTTAEYEYVYKNEKIMIIFRSGEQSASVCLFNYNKSTNKFQAVVNNIESDLWLSQVD